MSWISGFRALPPKTKNEVVAGGLTTFVFGVYFYTMSAVGGSDELEVAIGKFEEQKHRNEMKAVGGSDELEVAIGKFEEQ